MSSSTLIRGSGAAGIAFGVLVGASAGVRLAHGDASLAVWLAFAGVTLGFFALTGFYLSHSERTGVVGLIGFAIATAGFALSLGQLYGLTFNAPGRGPLGAAFPLGYGPFLFELLLFDLVIIWTDVLPRAAAGLLIVGAAMNAAGFAAVQVRLLGVGVFGAGVIWLSYANWANAMATTSRAATLVELGHAPSAMCR